MTTSSPFAATLAAKASLAGVRSHQHQRCTQTKRGNARGVTSAHILVADYQPQDWSAAGRAGFAGSLPTPANCRGSGLGIFHSHWLPSSSRAADRRVLCPSLEGIRRNSRVRAVTGCASHFHSANLAGANRLCVRNTLPNQHVSQAVADRLHHHRSFRNPSSFDGSRTIGKAFAKWTKNTSQSDKK